MISKKLFTAGINSDDADMLVDPKEYINALNIRFATTESGRVGQLSNIEGNTLKATTVDSFGVQTAWTLPAGTNTTIGAIEDTPNKRIFFFNKNSNGSDGIYCYSAEVSLIYTVLLASQVSGGLSFSSNIHSVAIIDNLLYWTDSVQPQRRINVDAGIKMNHPSYSTTVSPYVSTVLAPIKQSVISLIRNQPWAPITIQKVYEAGYVNNFIKNEAFEFAYRFVYRDYELSTFSPLSGLANYNSTGQTFNKIVVSLPSSQKIEQDVIRIEVAVRFVVGGKYSIVKTFTDPAAFSSHNTGTVLSFDFYNDTVGIAVDDATSFKQYDSIPLRSHTLEIAKNRLFLGNNYDGYEAPKSTSLQSDTTTGTADQVTGVWYKVDYTPFTGGGSTGTFYVVKIDGISSPGYHRIVPEQTTAPGTGSVNYANIGTTLIRIGAEYNDLKFYIDTVYGPSLINLSFEDSVTVINVPSGQATGLAGNRAFKSDSSYRLGVVFYDEAGRKCGVVTRDDLKKVTPDRVFATVSYVTDINWILSNDPSTVLSEIPVWAKYYSVVMTKGLRTSFFMQLKADAIKWVTKKDDGTYQVENTYSVNHYGTAIDVKSLFGINYGYSFQEGDLIKIYPNTGNTVTLSIKDTFGSYVVCDLYDLTGKTIIYEIYSPYTQSLNEPYYERAQTYVINNPGTTSRTFSTLTGSFNGDITLLTRGVTGSTYLVEAMSPSDINWKNWNTDAGRPNIVLDIKPADKETSVYFSNVIVLGSQTNGLSTFDVLDQTQLPYELTSIQKLQLVSKVESEGTVMLAVGEQETASMYLGESQVFDNTGSSFLAKSSGVVGNVNVMRGSYGTINPESVVRYMGNVYWFDANKGSVVSYSANGLFPISSNKMQKYFRKVGQDVLSKGLRFYGGVDPYHNEVLMYAPRKSANPEGARLTDMVLGVSTYSFTTVTSSSTITVVGLATYSYNGLQLGPNESVVTGSSGAVTYVYTGTGSTVYGPSSGRPTQVGTYQVVASVAADGVYDAATSAPFPFAVASVFVFDADYMLLTYQFTDGLDLDTRTRIVTPDVGQDTQPEYVGWGVSAVWPTTGTPILDWGGDNTGTGFESVLINVAQLKAMYPSAITMVVDLRAFWYNTLGVQPVNVAATLWKGGAPIEQGPGGSPAYSFTNPTATSTFNISSVGKQVSLAPTTNKAQSSGERVATLTYNLTTNTGSFNSNDTTTPSV